jgi:predicted TIM-barrel fold metal-dependent hydrolase
VRFRQEDVRIAVDALGADHVLFGLDYPWIDLEQSGRCVSHFLAMDFEPEVQQAILGENATKLLNV